MKMNQRPVALQRLLRHDLLPHAETVRLIRRAQAGDEQSMTRLVTHNQRLVFKISSLYEKCCHTMDIHDLMQEGTFGLMKAIRKYDPSHGVKLSTYSFKFIRFGILQAINRQDRLVRLPHEMHWHMQVIKTKRDELETKLGRPVTDEELLDTVEFKGNRSPASVLRISRRQFISFDEPAGPQADFRQTVGDMLPDRSMLRPDDILALKEALHNAHERIRTIARMVGDAPVKERYKRYFARYHGLDGQEEVTFPDLASEDGVSKQRVQQCVGMIWKRHIRCPGIQSTRDFKAMAAEISRLEDLTHTCLTA